MIENQNKSYSINCFRLINVDDLFLYDKFLQTAPKINVIDEIETQITDLIKIRNPHLAGNLIELNKAREKYIGNASLAEIGVWVYYPWRDTVVHLLDKQEFLEVRTNRNKNKITNAEQLELANKKVGIIGLSVGQSVATTLAMERSVGEIRLADFDKLDLSNCNRIRTSILNLNIPKVVITAREILEIDPFIKITCFEEGITENNIDHFFNEGGLLDLVVEECDSIDIKILSRQKAAAFKIPLIMEMSDKGLIDIERYDIDNDYKMFHGRLQDMPVDTQTIKNLNAEDKFKYMYVMVGGELVSERLLQSTMEIGKTLLTWPQLASAVVMGGGVSADVARRILLKQIDFSGRFYVDLEKIITNK
jgi:molybdopterin/thiamine biosynthesis adenylyltransferase